MQKKMKQQLCFNQEETHRNNLNINTQGSGEIIM